MRYQNWDVLLFPGESRVPIQEFDTKCHVLHEQNQHFVHKPVVVNELYFNTLNSLTQVPILTTFVASLDHGSPFRISIHSWEKPAPSQLLSSFKTKDEIVMFEARVYVDRVQVAQRMFGEQTTWPEVIDGTGTSSSDIFTKALRFPPFHAEILEQTHWEAGEGHGRIRVVLAEGILRERGLHGSQQYGFDKLRDLTAFSFQHVPKHILEMSGIAWPNAQMFRKSSKQQMNASSIGTGPLPVTGFEVHSHSPQRQHHTSSDSWYSGSHRFSQPPNTVPMDVLSSSKSMGFWPSKKRNNSSFQDSNACEDPFIGPTHLATRSKADVRRTSTDTSMPDYHSVTTRSDMSGIAYQPLNFQKQMTDAAVDEIIRFLSPEKRIELLGALSPTKSSNGVAPPVNTPDDVTHRMVSEDHTEARKLMGTQKTSITQRNAHNASLSDTKLMLTSDSNSDLPQPSDHTERTLQATATVRPDLLSALSSSLSSSLWQDGDPGFCELWSESSKLSTAASTRKTSNVPKRKRAESPVNPLYVKNNAALSLEPFGLEANMSTSPCKQPSKSPGEGGSPDEDGVSLKA